MIFLKRYMVDTEGEGGGDPPKKKDPPKGYKPTTPKERRDWNDMLDAMQKDGVAGGKELDQTDKNVGSSYIEKYRKDHPDTSITAERIPHIQYEQQQLRTGESFAGMSPEQTRVMRKQLDPGYLKRQSADPGTPFNSGMSRSYYPEFKKGDKNYGTDAESYMKDFAARPDEGPGDSPKSPVGKPTTDISSQRSKGKIPDKMDVRDVLSSFVGSGTKDFSDPERLKDFHYISEIIGQGEAHKLLTQAFLFNNREDMQGKSPQERVQAFYDIGSNDPELDKMIKTYKNVDPKGPLSGFETSGDYTNQKLTGRIK